MAISLVARYMNSTHDVRVSRLMSFCFPPLVESYHVSKNSLSDWSTDQYGGINSLPQYSGSGEAIHKVINDLDRSNLYFCDYCFKVSTECSIWSISFKMFSLGRLIVVLLFCVCVSLFARHPPYQSTPHVWKIEEHIHKIDFQ